MCGGRQEANLLGCGRRWAGFGILLSQWPEEDRDIRGYRHNRETCFIGNTWVTLTRWVSSPGMLKLQVLEVDLEILLLSFFMWILHKKMVDKRESVIVKMILAEIHQSSHKCSHSDIHTCPVVLPLESWDWTAPLTLPPRSVDRSQNSSAHWVGWHKQTLSPNPVSLVPQAELQ